MRADNLSEALPDPVDPAAPRIEQLLARGQALLADRGDVPRLQAELLLAHALGRPRVYLHAHTQDRIAASAQRRYEELLGRAAAGEPIAYLLGEREFWSLSLKVSPAVLVPRPETELAVARCLAVVTERRARTCDLGTGSGAIALALAVERPDWQITATDCSAEALELARLNAARVQVGNISFMQGDWLEPLAARRFDLIVSNPPYVAAGDPALQALRHEPRAALTPGATGAEALERIVVEAPAYLAPGGWLILEHGADQAEFLGQLLYARGYTRVQDHRDLAGHDRVIEAQWHAAMSVQPDGR
jgi:release factor glutamine methyltransferase